MFTGKRQFIDTRQWAKVEGDSLDIQFKNMSGDYCVYILRHWFYCASSAPNIATFYSKEDIEVYLNGCHAAGDRIEIWGVDLDANNFNPIISAKMPDENGLIPLKGAY